MSLCPKTTFWEELLEAPLCINELISENTWGWRCLGKMGCWLSCLCQSRLRRAFIQLMLKCTSSRICANNSVFVNLPTVPLLVLHNTTLQDCEELLKHIPCFWVHSFGNILRHVHQYIMNVVKQGVCLFIYDELFLALVQGWLNSDLNIIKAYRLIKLVKRVKKKGWIYVFERRS